MPLLVDTYNVLHVTGVLPPDLAGLDAEGLAALVADTGFRHDGVWLVCDGAPPRPAPRNRPGVVLTWAGAGQSADALLVRLVDRSSAPRRITVVTDDRAVRKSVKRRGATLWASAHFLARLAESLPRRMRDRGEPAKRPVAPLAPRDVRRWLHEFGLGDEELSLPASAPPQRSGAPAPRAPEHAASRPAEPRTARPWPDADAAGIDLTAIDLEALLAVPPPPRDEPRAPRRGRRRAR